MDTYTCCYLLMNVFLCKSTYGVVSYIGFFSELALAIVLSDDITDGDEGVVFVQLQALEKAGSSSALVEMIQTALRSEKGREQSN
jgi:hypothetical protein